eukprot:8726-Eustigmatos_ZCMA.PRE.1
MGNTPSAVGHGLNCLTSLHGTAAAPPRSAPYSYVRIASYMCVPLSAILCHKGSRLADPRPISGRSSGHSCHSTRVQQPMFVARVKRQSRLPRETALSSIDGPVLP